MSNDARPAYNGVLEKHPGAIAWAFGAIVFFGFLGGLYLNAGHH